MLVFGYKYDKGTSYEITVEKEGKYLYLKKPHAHWDNKEYRMDLSSGQFERINHYKTTGTKITPVKVKNITKWFSDCSIFCDDDKFARVILFNKYHWKNNRFKSGVRFIESLTNEDARNYEAWLSLGVKLTEIESQLDNCIKSTWMYNKIHKNVNYSPKDFNKQILKYIVNNFDEISLDLLSELRIYHRDNIDIVLIDELLNRTNTPQYRDFFSIKKYRYNDDSPKFSMFDLNENRSYSGLRMMRCVLKSITEFNLDIDTFLKFCLRMYNVEGLTAEDLFDSEHYYDYLDMERSLKNHKMPKMDKYPRNFLTLFQITKREYKIRKQEFEEKDFKYQCDKLRDLEHKFKQYSIIVPNKIADIENEADELKHCVRMYIPRVIKGETLICFLRDNEDIDAPLITIEVKDGCVTQAYGLHDSKPSDEQIEVMRTWADKHDLTLGWAWD